MASQNCRLFNIQGFRVDSVVTDLMTQVLCVILAFISKLSKSGLSGRSFAIYFKNNKQAITGSYGCAEALRSKWL